MQIPGRFRDRLLDRLIGDTPVDPPTPLRRVREALSATKATSPSGAPPARPATAPPDASVAGPATVASPSRTKGAAPERYPDSRRDAGSPRTPAPARGPTPAMVLGVRGERIAERFLQEKGWRTINRRFRSGHRDLDLVMERRGVVAFVEVKTRSGLTFGSPVEAVDWLKQRHLARAAQAWIAVHGRVGEDYRFDVVGVWFSGERVRVRHVPDAFRMPNGW